MEPKRVMRGMIVRITTDRLVNSGVTRGATGLTLYRADDGRWRLDCGGQSIDADEADFEVIDSALDPRGVVLPSLNGGWLSFRPLPLRALGWKFASSAAEGWGREPEEGDFFGHLSLNVPGDSTGFPVLWDRDRQLKLVYFLGSPDHMTWTFPQEYKLNWPDQDIEIEGQVTMDSQRGIWSEKAAEVRVTLRNPVGDRRHVSADLVFPVYACETASKWLVDLFPGVTSDDLDWI